MVAYLRLISLQQVFKQLAKAEYTLRMARNRGEMAEVLAEQAAENKVTVLFVGADEANWRKQA